MADPAWLALAGVSRRLVPVIVELPFSVQPPPGEATAVVPAAARAPTPPTATVVVRVVNPSFVVTVYFPVIVPVACGVKVTGMLTVAPAAMGWLSAGRAGVPNGTVGVVILVILTGVLPVLV